MQFAGVAHVVVAHWTKSGGFDRGDGDSATAEREELHFEGFAVIVAMHDGADIAPDEAVGGQVGQQMARSNSFMDANVPHAETVAGASCSKMSVSAGMGSIAKARP